MMIGLFCQICVLLARSHPVKDIPVVKIESDHLGVMVKLRTFDVEVVGYLGAVYLRHIDFQGTVAQIHV